MFRDYLKSLQKRWQPLLDKLVLTLREQPLVGALAAGIAVLLLTMVVLPGVFGPEKRRDPGGDGANAPGGPVEIIGFYVNWGGKAQSSQQSLEDNFEFMDSISPFWFSISPTGEVIKPGHRDEAFTFAKEKGLEVVVLINNNKGDTPDNAAMLRSDDRMDAAVRNIVSLIQEKGYDGVNIDFQGMPPEARDAFTNFIGKLAAALKPLDKTLAVSLFPVVGISEGVHGAHDYEALGKLVEYVVVMAYDYRWSTGPPGPISPFPWVVQNVEYAIDRVGAEKVVLAIGTYGLDWAEGDEQATDVAAREAYVIAKQAGAEIERDPESGQLHFVYWKNGRRHQVWFQDMEAAADRVRLARAKKLRGVAFWRIGIEEEGFWERVQEANTVGGE